MAIEEVYNNQSSAIASYNYEDLAENTGVKLFYAATTNSDEILTQNQIYSNNIELSGAVSSNAYAVILDKDFDLTAFNAPQIVRGTAYFNYTLYNSSAVDEYMHIYIRKWDGSAETEIANLSGALFISGAYGARVETLSIPITNTPFKEGEQLRVTANLYARRSTGAAEKVAFGSDPMNRDGALIIPSTDGTISQFKCWIPFNLDL